MSKLKLYLENEGFFGNQLLDLKIVITVVFPRNNNLVQKQWLLKKRCHFIRLLKVLYDVINNVCYAR